MKQKKRSTSFYVTPVMERQLNDLREYYGEHTSQIIARLVGEAHTRMQVEQNGDHA